MAGPKFSALAQLRKLDAADEVPPTPLSPAPQPPASAIVDAPRPPGRPPGKRSNAEWDYANILLRKQTKKLANRKLEDEGSDKDLSELVERLLGMYLRGDVS
jgi:hypothetical protein